MAPAGRVMDAFHLKPKSFIYDVTSTFVEGGSGADILQFRYSRDHRPDCRQVNYSPCLTMNPTVPLFHQAFLENTVDSKAVKETMVGFKDNLGIDGCLIVERGIFTSANIVEIVDERTLVRSMIGKGSKVTSSNEFIPKGEMLMVEENTALNV